MISGATRKGSTLEFGPEQEGVFDLLNDLREEFSNFTPANDLEKLASSGLLGYVQARLYEGN